MTVNDVPDQATPSIGPRSQILADLQPPLDALRDAEPASFDDYPPDDLPSRGVHPLDEPFDPNHPPQPQDGSQAVAPSAAPAFNFRSVMFAVGLVSALLVVVWLRGAVGGSGEPAGEPATPVLSRSGLVTPLAGPAPAQPGEAAPSLGAPAGPPAGGVSPVSNARPATADGRAQALAAPASAGTANQGEASAEVAPADPTNLTPASGSPPTAPPDDPSLNEPANGGSSAGAPMNSAGSTVSPIAVIPLGPRPGQTTTQRRGRTLQPAPAQVYEPHAQIYLDRANASRRLGDKTAAAADYRHAMDDFNLAVAHGEDPYTAQAGLQTARDGLRLVGH